jgi:hypothetical protein
LKSKLLKIGGFPSRSSSERRGLDPDFTDYKDSKIQNNRFRVFEVICGYLFGAVGEEEFEFGHVAVVTIEGGKGVGSFFKHLLGHSD